MRVFFSPPRLIEEFHQLSPFFTFFHLFSPFFGPSEDFSQRDGRGDQEKVKKGEHLKKLQKKLHKSSVIDF